MTHALPSPTFNVRNFHAVGDGTTDDTTAVQAAITAAMAAGGANRPGTVVVPPGQYKISTGLTIIPPAGSQVRVNLEGSPGISQLKWEGGNNTSVIRSLGWSLSSIRDISIDVGTATGMKCWDIDVDATRSSSAGLYFNRCSVNLNAGASNVGWRMGHSGATDVSFLTWDNCYACGNIPGVVSTQIGWVWENANCLAFKWDSSFASFLGKGWTGNPTSGSAYAQGGAGMTWSGCGASDCLIDFEFVAAGPYLISGGRFEDGDTFILTASGGYIMEIVVDGVQIASYPTAQTFDLRACVDLILRGLHVTGNNYGAAFIRNDWGFGGFGRVMIDGGSYQATAGTTDLVSPGTICPVTYHNVYLTDGITPLEFFPARRDYVTNGSTLVKTTQLSGSATWDPASTAVDAMTSTTVTVTGATVGDTVSVGFSTAVPAGALLVGSVTSANTVTVTLFNKSATNPLDLASGTLRVDVLKHG